MLKALNQWAGRWLTRTLTLTMLAVVAYSLWVMIWEAMMIGTMIMVALTQLHSSRKMWLVGR